MDKANSQLLVARQKHREVIRVSEKTEDLRFPRCWWADLIINHEVPSVCSRVPGTMSVEGKFEEKGRVLLRTLRAKNSLYLRLPRYPQPLTCPAAVTCRGQTSMRGSSLRPLPSR